MSGISAHECFVSLLNQDTQKNSNKPTNWGRHVEQWTPDRQLCLDLSLSGSLITFFNYS